MSISADPTGRGLTLRQTRDLIPRPATPDLLRLALDEGHTPDGATSIVVEHLVASGALADTPQLRGLIAAWAALIDTVRRRARTVAQTVIEHEAAELPDSAIEGLPDPSEELEIERAPEES